MPPSKVAEQFPPQLIPAGLDVTLPMPDLLTVSTKVGTDDEKVDVTVLDVFTVRLHAVPFAESHPLQLLNTDPAAADAVSVNAVPLS